MSALPINIVFCTQDLCYGGTQRQTVELVKRLDKQRFLASIWTLSGHTDLDDYAREHKIPVLNLSKSSTPTIFSIVSLFKHLKIERPQIFVPCTALPNIWGRILGKILNIPVIIGTCRGGGASKRQYERYLWRLTQHMICNSKSLYETISNIGMPSEQITYIPNGIDTEYFGAPIIPLNQRESLILCVGRLAADKDHQTLLKAFKIVLEKFPQAKLHIVGDGPKEADIRKIISHLALNNTVELINSSIDIRHHYQEAKIFALTSVMEGQPNVILEAMASGLPIVATNVGGIPNIVQDQHSGYLSQPGDEITIAHNICKLLNNSDLCQNMGMDGRNTVINNFSFYQMVNTHQKIFEKLWQVYKGNQI